MLRVYTPTPPFSSMERSMMPMRMKFFYRLIRRGAAGYFPFFLSSGLITSQLPMAR